MHWFAEVAAAHPVLRVPQDLGDIWALLEQKPDPSNVVQPLKSSNVLNTLLFPILLLKKTCHSFTLSVADVLEEMFMVVPSPVMIACDTIEHVDPGVKMYDVVVPRVGD